jgi:hypothetical protein
VFSWWVANGSLVSINNVLGANVNETTAIQYGGYMATSEVLRSIGDNLLTTDQVSWTQPTIPGLFNFIFVFLFYFSINFIFQHFNRSRPGRSSPSHPPPAGSTMI